jgi:LacI family transcriptional regulator
MRITLRHIAAHLGLDRSTISRGLRGDPTLPVSTRKRIEAAANELGYRPNPLLSELASSRWQIEKVTGGNVIGYIDQLLPEPDLGFGVAPPLSPTATEQARTLGYGLQVFRRMDFSSSAKLQRVLRSRGITDLILGPVYDEALTVKLDWDKFICVQLLPGYFPLPLHSVVKDHFNIVVLAWQKAASRGYRRIGITLPEHPNRLIDDVLRSSAVHACQEHFFSETAKLPVFKYLIHESGGKAFVDWVKKNKPDVIIGFSDFHFYYYRSIFGQEIP